MKRFFTVLLAAFFSCQTHAQYNLAPVTQLLTDSIGVIGQAGQNAGFLILHNDTLIYENYWGTWDSSTYQPIASGSKLPSMALMMRLIGEGALSVTDTVQNILSGFNGKPIITLHQLMSHTSGLPGQSSFISNNGLTLKQAVDSIGLKTPMTANAPGTAFLYGGVGMQVAGRMAEVATGKRWDSLFQQKIATPLGLSNTNYLGLGPTTNFRIAGGMGTTIRDFSKMLNLILNYGHHNGVNLIDTALIKMMQRDQTNGVPLAYTPYGNDTLRQDYRYGYGGWVEKEEGGKTTQFGSQGAFGFTPWIDRCRGLVCVLFVTRSLGAIQPTHTKLRSLIEQIIPLKLAQPVVTANGNTLQSSYPQGNQWYRNDTLLAGKTGTVLDPSKSGLYKVEFTSEEGCNIFSKPFMFTLGGMLAAEVEEVITVQPNPARNFLRINVPHAAAATTSICNLAGQEVLVHAFREGTTIDISGLPAAVYVVHVKTANAAYTQKLLISPK